MIRGSVVGVGLWWVGGVVGGMGVVGTIGVGVGVGVGVVVGGVGVVVIVVFDVSGREPSVIVPVVACIGVGIVVGGSKSREGSHSTRFIEGKTRRIRGGGAGGVGGGGVVLHF